MTLTQAITKAVETNSVACSFGNDDPRKSRNIVTVMRVASMAAAIKRYDVFQAVSR